MSSNDSGGEMIDPNEFAASLDGESEEPTKVAEGHTEAEGKDSVDANDMGSKSSLREMLFSTEPETPLEESPTVWDTDNGGLNRVYRGFAKMADIDGIPAILDIMIGIGEEVYTRRDKLGEAGATDDMEEVNLD